MACVSWEKSNIRDKCFEIRHSTLIPKINVLKDCLLYITIQMLVDKNAINGNPNITTLDQLFFYFFNSFIDHYTSYIEQDK